MLLSVRVCHHGYYNFMHTLILNTKSIQSNFWETSIGVAGLFDVLRYVNLFISFWLLFYIHHFSRFDSPQSFNEINNQTEVFKHYLFSLKPDSEMWETPNENYNTLSHSMLMQFLFIRRYGSVIICLYCVWNEIEKK